MTDTARFTELYRSYSVPIYRYVLHMTGRPETAEEITHDTFLEHIRRPDGFDMNRGTEGAYLYGIARHLLHRSLRLDRGFEQLDEEAIAEETSTLERLTAEQDLQVLQEEILALPEKYREAVVLCDLQEMTYDTAAVVAGCAVGTVRSRLNRGRALLISRMRARCAV